MNYRSYLELDQLLSLQHPRSEPAEHDEMLFIIVHQVYELWFKQLLHEIAKVKVDLSENRLFGALATFKRVRMVIKTLVGQLDILETMTPMSFSSFRDRLDTASGFQSIQYRELEFAFGIKRVEMLEHYRSDPEGRERMQHALATSSIVDHFYDFLGQNGVEIPVELREKDVAASTVPNEEIQRGLLELYRDRGDVGLLFELMMDVDEGLQEWRYRHVKIVERTIGAKRGTGGSLGVEFLKKSLFHAAFPDLWAIRRAM